jgi:hypothetical protein
LGAALTTSPPDASTERVKLKAAKSRKNEEKRKNFEELYINLNGTNGGLNRDCLPIVRLHR